MRVSICWPEEVKQLASRDSELAANSAAVATRWLVATLWAKARSATWARAGQMALRTMREMEAAEGWAGSVEEESNGSWASWV